MSINTSQPTSQLTEQQLHDCNVRNLASDIKYSQFQIVNSFARLLSMDDDGLISKDVAPSIRSTLVDVYQRNREFANCLSLFIAKLDTIINDPQIF